MSEIADVAKLAGAISPDLNCVTRIVLTLDAHDHMPRVEITRIVTITEAGSLIEMLSEFDLVRRDRNPVWPWPKAPA